MQILKAGFLFIVLLFLFKGFLFRSLFAYKVLHQRNLNDNQLNAISIENNSNTTIDDLTNVCLQQCTREIQFTSLSCSSNPSVIRQTHKANCVGYAQYFSEEFNKKKCRLNDEDWVAQPVVGQIYFMGMNLHHYIKTPFFKDHDFVILENKKSGSKFAVDPVVFDYFNIKKINLKN